MSVVKNANYVMENTAPGIGGGEVNNRVDTPNNLNFTMNENKNQIECMSFENDTLAPVADEQMSEVMVDENLPAPSIVPELATVAKQALHEGREKFNALWQRRVLLQER